MTKEPKKNIIICLDGTNNQFGQDKSNIIKLFQMLEREPGQQIAYYDPGVGTMGDPSYKTAIARKINQGLGLAFGRGLMKNLIEAYTFLMDHYNDGDQVFIFGFSRGAYTARALAAFIRDCGLFEKWAKNLLPYAVRLFLQEASQDEDGFYKVLSGFRSTYGRLLNRERDPRYPKKKSKTANYQLRIHFLGLFDTVKSYGWITNPIVLRNEAKNDSVMNVRHALSIDEKRIFFKQMHWKSSKLEHQSCKEVWFAGTHSDVGGGYPEKDSGLAKISLEWMVHEAIAFGLKVDLKGYGKIFLREQDEQKKWIPRKLKDEDKGKYAAPDASAVAHESLTTIWRFAQLVPKKSKSWETAWWSRTIKSQKERLGLEKDDNRLLIHESVIERINNDKIQYRPKNLLSRLELKGDINKLPKANIEYRKSPEEVFKPKRVEED